MYARTVTFDIDKELWAEALAFGASVEEQIAAFPGLRSWTLVGNPDTGEGTSFAVFESKQHFDTVNDQVNQILAGFATYFASPPNEKLGDVLAHVHNV
jgi:hypothetical protein